VVKGRPTGAVTAQAQMLSLALRVVIVAVAGTAEIG
jgi:hypothetical protein